jgi:hypothetical protein
MILVSEGPTPANSSNERPSLTSLVASSGQTNALRDARRSAFCNGCFPDSAAVANSSAMFWLLRLYY